MSSTDHEVTKVLIPAAGRGTRFLPFTKSVPKELAPIVTTPALELVVAEAAANGLADVLLVLSQGKGAIADYFAQNKALEKILQDKGDITGLTSVRRSSSFAASNFKLPTTWTASGRQPIARSRTASSSF